MSNLRYLSESQLVEALKDNTNYIAKLELELEQLEGRIRGVKNRLGGARVRRRWIVHYLSGAPEEMLPDRERANV